MAKPVHTLGCDELFILDPIMMYFHLGKGIHTTSQSYQAVMNESGVEYVSNRGVQTAMNLYRRKKFQNCARLKSLKDVQKRQ